MERIRLSAKPTKPARMTHVRMTHVKMTSVIMTLVILAIGAALVLGACRQQALLAPQPVGQRETVLMSLSLDSAAAAAHGVSRAAGPSDGGSSLRTILPATQGLGSLVYYISGTSTNSSQTLPVQQVTATVNAANASGTVSVALDRSVSWDLTLWACSAGATGYTTETQLDSNAVLKGRSYANLGTGGSAHFVLGTAGLTRQGTINLTVYGARGFPKPGYTGQSNGGRFEVEVWRKGDTARSQYFSNWAFHVDDGTNTNAANRQTWNSQLAPGTWYIDFTFQWPNETETYHYISEEFVISPGIATTVDLAIPNFIGTIPAAPTNFRAGYGSERTAGLFADQYLVYLSWQHAQSNHNGFELEFCELAYTGNDFPSSIDTATEWNQYTAGGKFFSYNSTSFAGSRWRNTGGLGSADRQCTLWLDLGKRYLFRIRAANGDGSSTWAYLSNLGLAKNNGQYATTDPWPDGLAKNEAPRFPDNVYGGYSGLFPGWTVHRGAINYDIGPYGWRNLTRFKRSGKDMYSGSSYIREFYSQGRPGTSISIEDYHEATDGSTLVIKYPKGGSNITYLSRWHFWNGAALFPNSIRSSGNWTGHQNLYLYASWEHANASDSLAYQIQRDWLTFNGTRLNTPAFTPTGPDDVLTLSLSKAAVGAGTVPLVINVPTTSKARVDGYVNYARATVRVQHNNNYGIMYGHSQSMAAFGNPTTFQIGGVSEWATGSYRVTVELKTNSYWVYRYYFDINLTP